MKLSMIGCGYVGLCTGVGFAKMGHEVIAVDIDEEKVRKFQKGETPIFEIGLEKMLKEVGDRFRATTDINEIKNTDFTFISVGTPSRSDGSIDTKYIEQAARDIAKVIKDKENHTIIVKSTVIPGTSDRVAEIIEEVAGKKFPVAMNPEFLREGSALSDFLEPDSIVIGGNPETAEKVAELYKPFNREVLKVPLRTAEMIKYAKNAYLAKDISFANEIANICEKMGIDYEEVKKGIGEDSRIGKFINAGVGYGGSCFPKDVQAIIAAADQAGYEPQLLKKAHEINEKQKTRIVDMIDKTVGLDSKKIGILGLAFKPGTDDIREAPSVEVIKKLLDRGVDVTVYDPEAMENIQEIFGQKLNYGTKEDCLQKDIIIILTEWNEFKDIGPQDTQATVFDGRRVLDKTKFPAGKYYGIGLGTTPHEL